MFVDRVFLFRNQVIDLDAVRVHVNGLVTDHQLLALVDLVSDNHNVSIVNVQSALYLKDELVLLWRSFIKLKQEDTQFVLVLVCKQVEYLVFSIVLDFFDVLNPVKFTKINHHIFVVVEVYAF